jgi:alpha-1,4-galacturonosyltransferase
MALKRGFSISGLNKNRRGGSRLPIVVVIFFCVLSPLIFFVGRGLYTTSSSTG